MDSLSRDKISKLMSDARKLPGGQLASGQSKGSSYCGDMQGERSALELLPFFGLDAPVLKQVGGIHGWMDGPTVQRFY
jgi:hypothetical protein